MLPTKKRRRRPVRVSCSSRALARRVELKPATSLVISRSIIRMTASSDSNCRSRSWTTKPVRLLPVIEHLLGPAVGLLLALADFGLDVDAASGPARPTAVVQVGVITVEVGDIGYQHFLGAAAAGLDDQVPPGQVLQQLCEALAAVEGVGHLVGVDAGELKERVRADGHDGGAHLRRILFQELVGGNNTDAELAGFGKQRVQAGIIGDQVLDLVAVQGEQLPPRAGKQGVLEFGQKHNAAEWFHGISRHFEIVTNLRMAATNWRCWAAESAANCRAS